MIDTHCHLDFPDYAADREEVIRATYAGGVTRLINIGIDEKTSIASLKLADEHEFIYATVGCHPHEASGFDRRLQDTLERLAQHPKVVAIGEVGLDYYRKHSPREDQINAFRRQLRLAQTLELPIVVHIREAMAEALDILEEEQGGKFGGTLHCFPGSLEDSRRASDLNLMVSFGGAVTFEKSRAREVAARMPLDRMLLETDAPFITPVPFRGKRNSPLYVQYVYRQVAELRQMPLPELEKKIDANAARLFNLS